MTIHMPTDEKMLDVFFRFDAYEIGTTELIPLSENRIIKVWQQHTGKLWVAQYCAFQPDRLLLYRYDVLWQDFGLRRMVAIHRCLSALQTATSVHGESIV